MPGRVLLDTSILVDHLRGDSTVEARLAESEEVFVSVIALGELLYGVRRSAHPDAGRALVDEFFEGVSVLPCDRVTAEAYSRLKDSLRRKGRPIPDNDLWIGGRSFQECFGAAVLAEQQCRGQVTGIL